MKRSLLLVLVLVISISIVLSFSFAGCKTSAAEEAPAEEVSEEVGGTLSILCFQGYAEDDWVKPFEEKYNCKVEITYAGTVEEHFTKTKAAPDQYNIISNDSGRVQMYYDAGLIQAIDVSKLENYSKVGEYFRKHPYAEMEEGKKFHVPITWGDQDFIVNTAAVGDELEAYLTDAGDGKQTLSYEVMKAPEFEGLVTMFDEATNVTNMSAIAAGCTPPFTLDEDGYTAMIEELTAWAESCRTFTAGFDSEKSILTGEDAYVSITGNNGPQALGLVEEGVGDKFTHFLPTEGTIAWIDGWVITKPTEGASLDLALKYIDYMIGDEGQAKLAELVGFGIVNAGGSGGYTDVLKERLWWYSGSIDDLPVPLYVMVTEEDPERRVDTWNEIKAGLGF
jgi:putative spermidine/putrescine transport system substrate-binding protein/spermidine/putrescine transport system substrate-binding protein